MPTEQPGQPDEKQPSEMTGESSGMTPQQHIIELQRANRALRLLSSVNQALMYTTSEAKFIQQICEVAVDVGQYRLAWVGFIEHDKEKTIRPICHAGREEGFLHEVRFTWEKGISDRAPWSAAIHTEKPATISDITQVPADVPWRDAALARGYRSMIVLPLSVEGHTIGTLTLLGDRAQEFSQEELQLLMELTGDLSFGIATLRTRERERRTEKRLQQSESRLHALIAAAPYGAHEYELQPDGRLIFIGYNPAANRILGVDHARFLGKTIEEAFPPLTDTHVPDAYRHVARTGEPYEEEQVTYEHGDIVGAYEISAFQTAPGRMAVFFRDITERKRAAQQLHESEEKYRFLFDTMAQGVVLQDTETRIIEANPAASRILGLSMDQLLQKTSYDLGWHLIHEDHTPFAPEEMPSNIVLRTGEPVTDIVVGVYIPKLDAYHWIIISSVPKFHAGEDKPYVTMTTFTDITELKRTEEALRKSEAMLRAIYEATTNVAFIITDATDLAPIVLEFSPGAEHIFGYTRDEIVGQPVNRLHRQEDIAQFPAVHHAMREGKTGFSGETVLIRKNGEEFPALFSTYPLFDEQGTMYAALGVSIDITALKRAEATLRENEDRLSLVIRNSPDLVYILDSDLRYIWVPKTIFDMPLEDLVGKTDHDLFQPEDADRLGRINRQVMNTGESIRYELIVPTAGKTYYFENTALPWRDTATGQIVGVVVYVHDVSERKHAEQALQEREALLRAVVDNAPFEIWARDLDERCILVNKTLVQHWGNLLGQRPEDTGLPPEELALWRENNRRAYDGEMVDVEEEYLIAGEQRIFQNIVVPIYTEGRLLGIMGFNIDITERKHSEEAIKRESTFLASAIELLPFPIFFITPSFEVIRQNRASFSLQHAPTDLPLGGVEFLDPETHAPYPIQEWPINQALHGETAPTREFILRQPDGREISILLQTAPVFINDELVAAVVAIQDLTAVKEADRAKNQFLMVLSHEIKTPLTSIIGWAQLAQTAPDVIPEALATILRNAHAQKMLLERLLILSRILTGKLTLSRKPNDLWQLALRVAQRLHHAAEERKISMELAPPASELVVEADEKLLEQAIYEVIDNAINFTPAGGSITVQGRREEMANTLIVRDTGQGIAPEQLSTLLKPFTQIQRKEELGGLGIGLALVRGIIESHGGQVTINSVGEKLGTTVIMRLPSVETHRAENGHGTEATSGGSDRT